MAQHRTRASTLLLVGSAALVLARVGLWLSTQAFAGAGSPRCQGTRVSRQGLADTLDLSSVQKTLQDPKKMEEMQKVVDDLIKDPAKKKMFEDYNTNMQQAVEKLKNDPEMKDFFEDVEKNGMEAFAKYENDERILRKFSMATGGLPDMPPSFKPGDEVFITGLAKAPELNGKKAMVVPPTPEESKSLEGTDRLIVRLVDTGDQVAVQPTNLMTPAQEAASQMSKGLDDISVHNPALQTEAAKLRESGALDNLQNDPELKPIFEDIKKNGMGALEKYWNDEKVMTKISKAMSG